jgi:ATP-dependent DNA helicase RecG
VTGPGEGIPEPLKDVVGPLTFATRPETPIERIAGLEAMVRGKMTAWRVTLAPGAPMRGRVDRWLAALEGCEDLPPEARRACLKGVLAGITALERVEAPAGPGPGPVALTLDADVRFLPGVGERRAEGLARLGIRTVEDLLLHLPARYDDRRTITPIAGLVPGAPATVRGRVVQADLTTTPRRRMRILEAAVVDASGAEGLGGMLLARWFNQPHQARLLKTGETYLFSGRVIHDRRGLGLVMENPEFEPWEEGDAALHTGRLVPVYPTTEGITTRQLRRWTAVALERAVVPEPLPAPLRERLGLPERFRAFVQVHRPTAPEDSAAGTRRLAFEEFFFLQVGLALKQRVGERRRTRIRFATEPGALEQALRAALPFALTGAQERVLGEVFADLARGVPMHRLVQGDVGCGKTAVAALALARAVDNGFQGAMMAPTELLAGQHFARLTQLLDGLPVRVDLLVGGRRGKPAALKAVASGETHIVVGTQALIQEQVAFHRLGLAVVDEQHRFGVRQRARIGEKGDAPHVLIMTATPIPRSLAMTAYGDLDLSVIDELPPGRTPVATRLFNESRRDAAYAKVRKEVEAGRRAYVVFPLVAESEKLDLAAATEAREALAEGPLQGLSLGLLHGRMSGEEKAAVMADFAAGRVRVLVATTVVEVGVDVPEATVMVVEHAERFGLSQLHQLRGRVGRGAHPGHCLLIASHAVSKDGRERLKALVETNDGFRIAERDLEIRGPGELFGQRQSGLPELKVANIIRDGRLLAVAREAARELVAADPDLADPAHRQLRRSVAARWRHRLKWGAVG